MLFSWDGAEKVFIDVTAPCVDATITDHLEVFFRDMANQTFNELHDWDCLLDIDIILVTVVMKGNKVAIIFINA